MLLYNFTFPKEGICTESELYHRGGTMRADGIFLRAGEEVNFDTYFNSFSHIKYRKYTRVKVLRTELDTIGRGEISLHRYISDGETEVIASEIYDGAALLEADISDLADEGFLFIRLKATSDTVISGGRYLSDVTPHNVKIGAVICTFRREEFVKRNVNNLKEFLKSRIDRDFDVFIIDNGRTLKNEFGEGVEVIPNANTGGSGGFIRGIKEVYKRDYTHFLLMDDDILFDCNVFERTACLLRCLKEEYRNASVGGGMLILDKPCIQKELGGNWVGNRLSARQEFTDVTEPTVIKQNEELPEPDYSAWWYMCMPVNSVQKFGYPLSMFIRCDDVEYGLRAAENIILTSGIAVWHESFDNKLSPETEYYVKRNELIVNALYPKGKGALSNWWKLVKCVGKQLSFHRYYAVDLLFRAYDDFLKGAKFFKNIDSEKLHLELREKCPRFLNEAELKEKYGITVNREQILVSKSIKSKKIPQLLTCNGYLIPRCFYKKEIGQADLVKCKASAFYMHSRMLQFNIYSNQGFVTEIKKSAIFTAAFKLFIYFFKMIFKGRKTAKDFRENVYFD